MYICISKSKGVIRFVTCFLHLIISGNVFKFPLLFLMASKAFLYNAPQSENGARKNPSDPEALMELWAWGEGWEGEDVTLSAKARARALRDARRPEGGAAEREEGAGRGGAGRGGAARSRYSERAVQTEGGKRGGPTRRWRGGCCSRASLEARPWPVPGAPGSAASLVSRRSVRRPLGPQVGRSGAPGVSRPAGFAFQDKRGALKPPASLAPLQVTRTHPRPFDGFPGPGPRRPSRASRQPGLGRVPGGAPGEGAPAPADRPWGVNDGAAASAEFSETRFWGVSSVLRLAGENEDIKIPVVWKAEGHSK